MAYIVQGYEVLAGTWLLDVQGTCTVEVQISAEINVYNFTLWREFIFERSEFVKEIKYMILTHI